VTQGQANPAYRQPVVAIIPAYNESGRIGATVRAVMAVGAVNVVLVVDDGSTDATSQRAQEAGALVVRHARNRGKAAAMETGAAVVAMWDAPADSPQSGEVPTDSPAVKPPPTGSPQTRPTPDILLFIDADLADSATRTAALIDPVVSGQADFTVAVLPRPAGAGGWGLVLGLARWGIKAATGFTPRAPLSGQRCLTRQAFDRAIPLAKGWGVETAMTIDLLRQGFTIQEIDCDLHHRASGKTWRGAWHRAAQCRDVAAALLVRGLRLTGGLARTRLKQTLGGPRPPRRP